MSELAGQVRAALSARVSADPERMGYFSAPFRPADGPLSGQVLKPYRSGRDPELLEQLARRHEAYMECIARAGLALPPTRLVLLDEHGVLRPVIVQAAVPADALLAALVARAEIDVALGLLERVAAAVCAFWAGVAQRPERIGLHASIHNFALDAEAGPVFLDTFPPLIGYGREDIGRLLLRFSESGLIRGVGKILPGRVREIQDPWYSLPGNLRLLVEGSIRLRPADRNGLLAWAERFATTALGPDDRSILLTGLASRPPRIGRRGRIASIGNYLPPNA